MRIECSTALRAGMAASPAQPLELGAQVGRLGAPGWLRRIGLRWRPATWNPGGIGRIYVCRQIHGGPGSTSQRTRDALAAKRARGERLGAAPALPVEVTRRIVIERGAGQTLQAIADALMADGVPTSRGKTRWYPATIRAVVTSDNAAALL
jgi:Recombinase